jgi:hypothetical protein
MDRAGRGNNNANRGNNNTNRGNAMQRRFAGLRRGMVQPAAGPQSIAGLRARAERRRAAAVNPVVLDAVIRDLLPELNIEQRQVAELEITYYAQKSKNAPAA